MTKENRLLEGARLHALNADSDDARVKEYLSADDPVEEDEEEDDE
jgi:hypothetical protein